MDQCAGCGSPVDVSTDNFCRKCAWPVGEGGEDGNLPGVYGEAQQAGEGIQPWDTQDSGSHPGVLGLHENAPAMAGRSRSLPRSVTAERERASHGPNFYLAGQQGDLIGRLSAPEADLEEQEIGVERWQRIAFDARAAAPAWGSRAWLDPDPDERHLIALSMAAENRLEVAMRRRDSARALTAGLMAQWTAVSRPDLGLPGSVDGDGLSAADQDRRVGRAQDAREQGVTARFSRIADDPEGAREVIVSGETVARALQPAEPTRGELQPGTSR
jgi:hypothetical protein